MLIVPGKINKSAIVRTGGRFSITFPTKTYNVWVFAAAQNCTVEGMPLLDIILDFDSLVVNILGLHGHFKLTWSFF